jgi:group I intron endonuclease
LPVRGVYTITNLENGTKYIGSSMNVEKRMRYHRNQLDKGNHPNPHLQSAWKVYGVDAFVFELLEEVESSEELLVVEQKYLDSVALQPLYNIRKEASSNRGLVPSRETREKLSKALKGHPVLPETRELIRQKRKGWVPSPETLARMKVSNPGRKHTEETKRKMSETRKGRPCTWGDKISEGKLRAAAKRRVQDGL